MRVKEKERKNERERKRVKTFYFKSRIVFISQSIIISVYLCKSVNTFVLQTRSLKLVIFFYIFNFDHRGDRERV